MAPIAALALAATLTSVPNPATTDARLVQMYMATAVWLVDIDVRLYGEFIKDDNGEYIGTDIVAKLGMWGTATAVSDDGELLTNRHVVDPRYLVAVTCKEKRKEYIKSTVTSARINFLFMDVAGEPVPGVVTVTAAQGDSDVCTDAMNAQWEVSDGSDVHIVALDELSDLALVKIRVGDIPHITPTTKPLNIGDEVYSLGYDGRNQRLVRVAGVHVADCKAIAEETPEDDIAFLPQPQPLAESTVPVRKGMSGGPLLAGATLVGINVMSDAECPDEGECTTKGVTSDAIPGYYAVGWYRWITSKDKHRPVLCTPPSPPTEEVRAPFDPFAPVQHP